MVVLTSLTLLVLGGGAVYDLYCSKPPGGDGDTLASLVGGVMSSIFIWPTVSHILATIGAGTMSLLGLNNTGMSCNNLEMTHVHAPFSLT